MKIPMLVLLLALTIATDLAYRNWWFAGLATPDPTLLFLLWLSHLDRRSRVHVAIGAIAIVRAGAGSDPVWRCWLPLALAAETVLCCRYFINIRDGWVRIVPVTVGLVVGLTTSGVLFGLPVDLWFLGQVGRGAGVGVLSAVILFPILDAVKPLLRSYSYPL